MIREKKNQVRSYRSNNMFSEVLNSLVANNNSIVLVDYFDNEKINLKE